MALVTFPWTGQPVTQERLMTFLKNNGVTSVVGAITGQPDQISIEITDLAEAAEIEALLANYTDPPTPSETWQENAIQDAIPLIKDIAKIPRAQRNANQKIILGIALMLKDLRVKPEEGEMG